MNVPTGLKYADTHEWLRAESDGTVTIGITDHAQAALGDLVYIDLPKAGRRVEAGEACAVVESVKAASDVYAQRCAGRRARGCERGRVCRVALPPASKRSGGVVDVHGCRCLQAPDRRSVTGSR